MTFYYYPRFGWRSGNVIAIDEGRAMPEEKVMYGVLDTIDNVSITAGQRPLTTSGSREWRRK